MQHRVASSASLHPSATRGWRGSWRFGNADHDKRSLLRHALATASIYGVCSYRPSGPAPKFAGANLMPGPFNVKKEEV
jgi:hypothetical protein